MHDRQSEKPAQFALLLNGEPYQAAEGATVLDLVAGLGRDPRAVAVERNGELLPRAAYAVTRLAAGDRLEVVHFVQGGCDDEVGCGSGTAPEEDPRADRDRVAGIGVPRGLEMRARRGRL